MNRYEDGLEKTTDKDTIWLLLFLLFSYCYSNKENTSDLGDTLRDKIAKMDLKPDPNIFPIDINTLIGNSRLSELQKQCQNIEWEQDMNARIPFCKLDSQICNGQCKRSIL